MYLIQFENQIVGEIDNLDQLQRAIADHIGTWAGNGVTCRITERQVCDHHNDIGHCIRRIHIESWHRCVLSMFRYHIYEK
jgi:hypothetical protein